MIWTMAEKPRDLWQVPLVWLRDRRRLGEVGVKWLRSQAFVAHH